MKKVLPLIFLLSTLFGFSQKRGVACIGNNLCNITSPLKDGMTLKFLDNLTFEERVKFGRLDNTREPLFINNGYTVSKEEFLSVFENQEIETIEFIENPIPLSCRPIGVVYLMVSE